MDSDGHEINEVYMSDRISYASKKSDGQSDYDSEKLMTSQEVILSFIMKGHGNDSEQ